MIQNKGDMKKSQTVGFDLPYFEKGKRFPNHGKLSQILEQTAEHNEKSSSTTKVIKTFSFTRMEFADPEPPSQKSYKSNVSNTKNMLKMFSFENKQGITDIMVDKQPMKHNSISHQAIGNQLLPDPRRIVSDLLGVKLEREGKEPVEEATKAKVKQGFLEFKQQIG